MNLREPKNTRPLRGGGSLTHDAGVRCRSQGTLDPTAINFASGVASFKSTEEMKKITAQLCSFRASVMRCGLWPPCCECLSGHVLHVISDVQFVPWDQAQFPLQELDLQRHARRAAPLSYTPPFRVGILGLANIHLGCWGGTSHGRPPDRAGLLRMLLLEYESGWEGAPWE